VPAAAAATARPRKERTVPAAIAPSWPDTRTEFWSWRLEGACRTAPWLFFSPDGERARSRASRERAAKAICRGCTVLDVCAAYAVACQEPYGTWGGMSERDRRAGCLLVDPVQAEADYRQALAA
jgi:WhiB family redox-sensing transcriptional regulator